ncbi:hypothetical protein FOA52_014516 [Chlamydomonas sp. UWO 241]|nr:hypothetical protein FOA52_014516 [Chlamydomonas sp. UWO 241]
MFADVQARAAYALRHLTSGHAQNQAAVAAAGAIPALVRLLQDSEDAHDEAAGALQSLARHHNHNQAAIADAGTIPALVRLLCRKDEYLQFAAACALDDLAANHAQNQTAIADAGAIPLLADLVFGLDTDEMYMSSDTKMVFEAAAAALDRLAAGNAPNQAAIAVSKKEFEKFLDNLDSEEGTGEDGDEGEASD